MKNKVLFFLLLFVVVVFTNIHSIEILLLSGVFFLFLSQKIAYKSFKAILFFNLSVTIGYLIQSAILSKPLDDFLLIFNLRVFDITFITLYGFGKINIIEAVSFSKSLKFLFVATLSQISSFRKTYDDFILSLKSRSVNPLSQKNKKEFISSMFYYFLKKSLHNSHERTLALKARGFFD